jgi:hypothetical protein
MLFRGKPPDDTIFVKYVLTRSVVGLANKLMVLKYTQTNGADCLLLREGLVIIATHSACYPVVVFCGWSLEL